MIDYLFNPILFMQSRFILQNRIANFSIYQSIPHFMRKFGRNPRVTMAGANVHLPKNIILSIGGADILPGRPQESYMLSNLIGSTLSYPLLTVMRRLHCQTLDTPGMIPIRYTGVFHALKLIKYEEGFKGLYGGFLAYILVVIIFFI